MDLVTFLLLLFIIYILISKKFENKRMLYVGTAFILMVCINKSTIENFSLTRETHPPTPFSVEAVTGKDEGSGGLNPARPNSDILNGLFYFGNESGTSTFYLGKLGMRYENDMFDHGDIPGSTISKDNFVSSKNLDITDEDVADIFKRPGFQNPPDIVRDFKTFYEGRIANQMYQQPGFANASLDVDDKKPNKVTLNSKGQKNWPPTHPDDIWTPKTGTDNSGPRGNIIFSIGDGSTGYALPLTYNEDPQINGFKGLMIQPPYSTSDDSEWHQYAEQAISNVYGNDIDGDGPGTRSRELITSEDDDNSTDSIRLSPLYYNYELSFLGSSSNEPGPEGDGKYYNSIKFIEAILDDPVAVNDILTSDSDHNTSADGVVFTQGPREKMTMILDYYLMYKKESTRMSDTHAQTLRNNTDGLTDVGADLDYFVSQVEDFFDSIVNKDEGDPLQLSLNDRERSEGYIGIDTTANHLFCTRVPITVDHFEGGAEGKGGNFKSGWSDSGGIKFGIPVRGAGTFDTDQDITKGENLTNDTSGGDADEIVDSIVCCFGDENDPDVCGSSGVYTGGEGSPGGECMNPTAGANGKRHACYDNKPCALGYSSTSEEIASDKANDNTMFHSFEARNTCLLPVRENCEEDEATGPCNKEIYSDSITSIIDQWFYSMYDRCYSETECNPLEKVLYNIFYLPGMLGIDKDGFLGWWNLDEAADRMGNGSGCYQARGAQIGMTADSEGNVVMKQGLGVSDDLAKYRGRSGLEGKQKEELTDMYTPVDDANYGRDINMAAMKGLPASNNCMRPAPDSMGKCKNGVVPKKTFSKKKYTSMDGQSVSGLEYVCAYQDDDEYGIYPETSFKVMKYFLIMSFIASFFTFVGAAKNAPFADWVDNLSPKLRYIWQFVFGVIAVLFTFIFILGLGQLGLKAWIDMKDDDEYCDNSKIGDFCSKQTGYRLKSESERGNISLGKLKWDDNSDEANNKKMRCCEPVSNS